MIHYTKMGIHADLMKPFADKNGMVPQPGDSLKEFQFPSGFFDSVWLASAGLDSNTKEGEQIIQACWKQFVQDAERQVLAINEMLEKRWTKYSNEFFPQLD
jgi:hypothetical protein